MKPVVWLALSLLLTAFAFQNCGSQMTTGFSDAPVMIDPELQKVQAPDCTFNRTGLLNGEEVVAYRVSTVPLGTPAASGCEAAANKEIRKCENGILNGVYQFAKCQPGAPRSCVVDGITVGHGQSIKLYQVNDYLDATPGCEGTSNWKNVVCNDGRFDSNFPTYKYSLCQDRKQFDCKYDLAQPAILEGNGKYFYKNSNPTATDGCQREYRRCVGGKLLGTMNGSQAVFTQIECREQPGRKCSHPVPGQPDMDHTQTIAFYPVASVANGQQCPVPESRQCKDGALLGRQDAVYLSCAPREAASCSLGASTVANGATADAFKIPVAASQEICDQAKSRRKCTNGDLDGTDDYQFPECRVDANAASCTTTDDEPVLHGQPGTFYSRNLTRSDLSTAAVYCSASDNARTLRCDAGQFRDSADQLVPITQRVYKHCPGRMTQLPAVGNYVALGTGAVCAEGKRIKGIFGIHRASNFIVNKLGVICEDESRSATIGGNGVSTNPSDNYVFNCPAGKFLVGLYYRYSAEGFVTRLDTACAAENGEGFNYHGIQAGQDNGNPVAHRICPAGQIVGRLRAETGANTTSLRPANVECIKVAKAIRVDCQGMWIDQPCQADGLKRRKWLEIRPSSGGGAQCEAANEEVQTIFNESCGGGGGPNPNDPPPECTRRESEAGVEIICP